MTEKPTPATAAARGFGRMDPARQREIARKGGLAAQKKGSAHRFTAEEGRKAGRKGGAAISNDRAHMSMIGRKGGRRRLEPTPTETP